LRLQNSCFWLDENPIFFKRSIVTYVAEYLWLDREGIHNKQAIYVDTCASLVQIGIHMWSFVEKKNAI